MNGQIVNDFPAIDISVSYEAVKKTAQFLLDRTSIRPKVGLVCGSGMGPIASIIKDTTEFDYKDIPNFPRSTVHGHAGKLIFGYIGEMAVLCMQGRVHYYEGYSLAQCAMPIRVMKLCGITHVIMSNAAGGINPEFKIGDIMLIRDHINYLNMGGMNPLIGPNDERWGERFVALNKTYSAPMQKRAIEIAKELNIYNNLHTGTFGMVAGPSFETVAELRKLMRDGIDAVGMSTVSEAITARHCGIIVFAFSLITNKAVMDYDTTEEPNHLEVIDMAKKRGDVIKEWISRIIGSYTESTLPSE